MGKKQTIYRQGDVMLIRVGEIPEGCTKEELKGNRVVLAEGEVTGHTHSIASTQAEAFLAAEGVRYLQVRSGGADLVHEEHDTIHLPEDVYEIRQQREYSPEAIRPVGD